MSASTSESPILQRLRSTLADHPPFCSGTLGLQPRNFTLYYGKGKHARQLDLSGADATAVKALYKLEAACEAATFGKNAESVLDETYRKAGKLDTENFLLGLDVERSRLVDIVRAGLLAGEKELKPIKAELYKINVYGKDAFFKPHKDTPRGTDMFGSLVLIFPTPHEGGALVLRHQGDEWTFDAAQILSTTAHYDLKRVAYIAFFSDVEHEVLPVTSGHRVTITYNLYWGSPPPVALPQELSVIYPKHSNFSAEARSASGYTTRTRLRRTGQTRLPKPLETLRGWLKGSDSALFHALQVLSLDPLLRLVYKDEEFNIVAMVDSMVDLGHIEDEMACDMLLKYQGALVLAEKKYDGTVKPAEELKDRLLQEMKDNMLKDTSSMEVYWVTPCGNGNSIGSQYTAYFGNEPGVEYLYLTPSLFVDIGPPGDRANIEGVEGVHATKVKKKFRYWSRTT